MPYRHILISIFDTKLHARVGLPVSALTFFRLCVLLGMLLLSGVSNAQTWDPEPYTGNKRFKLADTLKGALTPNRACFDVISYGLNIKIIPDSVMLKGNVLTRVRVTRPTQVMQLDLVERLRVDSVTYGNAGKLPFVREGNTFTIKFPSFLAVGSLQSFRVYYQGRPKLSGRPPWENGMIRRRDALYNEWLGMAAEHDGASIWFPCKDHLSDEPETTTIRLEVPDTLMGISNGKLTRTFAGHSPNWRIWEWKVSYPINNYNITFNVGKYAHYSDTLISKIDGYKLPLDYYILTYNTERALPHFRQIKEMLNCYEGYFGPYPFRRDGYKVTEAPMWGMEHQSNIAYNNGFVNNEFGFDFILIHESGHEWWGNSLSMADHADLWLHESFCTYAEALYVECRSGKGRAQEYLDLQRPKITNKEAIIGVHNVNYHYWPDADAYYKGTWLLHTLRYQLNDDVKWFKMIKGLQSHFAYKTTTTQAVIDYINKALGADYTWFFRQYLTQKEVPAMQYYFKGDKLLYKWQKVLPDFKLPVPVTVDNVALQVLKPSLDWQEVKVDGSKLNHILLVDTRQLLIDVVEAKPTKPAIKTGIPLGN